MFLKILPGDDESSKMHPMDRIILASADENNLRPLLSPRRFNDSMSETCPDVLDHRNPLAKNSCTRRH